jgi:hypothetical protein
MPSQRKGLLVIAVVALLVMLAVILFVPNGPNGPTPGHDNGIEAAFLVIPGINLAPNLGNPATLP